MARNAAVAPRLSGTSRVIAFQTRLRSEGADDIVYAAFNMFWETLPFCPPTLDDGRSWHVFVNTGVEPPHDVYPLGSEPLVEESNRLIVGGRSIVILVPR